MPCTEVRRSHDLIMAPLRKWVSREFILPLALFPRIVKVFNGTQNFSVKSGSCDYLPASELRVVPPFFAKTPSCFSIDSITQSDFKILQKRVNRPTGKLAPDVGSLQLIIADRFKRGNIATRPGSGNERQHCIHWGILRHC